MTKIEYGSPSFARETSKGTPALDSSGISGGNGTKTYYKYNDLTLRLGHLKTFSPNVDPQEDAQGWAQAQGDLQDLSYIYDAVGNIKTIVDGVRGHNQYFDYDELNRLTSATGYYCSEGAEECAKTYAYDEIGNITKKGDLTYHYGSPSFTSKTGRGAPALDSSGISAGPHAVTRITDPSGVDVFKFEYDANGNMVKMDQRQVDGTTITTEYIYDSENRLSEVKKSATNLGGSASGGQNEKIAEYTYDGDGGRVKKRVFPSATNLGGSAFGGKSSNSSLQTQAPGVGFTFKPSSRSKYWDLGSDSKGLALSEQSPSTSLETSESKGSFSNICGEGMPPELCNQKRIEAALANTTRYVGSLYEEVGQSKIRHIFLGGTRVASVTDGKVSYYHTNHLGSTNVVTSASGEITELIEYEPWGTFATHEKYPADGGAGGSDSDIAWYYFTGKPLDDETGLYYYGARYYNPSLGRFITPDTIVQSPDSPQTLNRYSYVSNNPINRIDPTGHSWKSFWKKFGDFISPFGRAIVTGDWKNFGYQLLNIATIVIGVTTANPWLIASGGLSYASRATSHIGGNIANEISSVLGYAGLAAGVIGAGIEIKNAFAQAGGTAGAGSSGATSGTGSARSGSIYQKLSAPEYREDVLTMMFNDVKTGVVEKASIAQVIADKAAFTAGVVADTLGEYYSKTAATFSKFAPAWKTGIGSAKNFAKGFGAAGFALDTPVYFEIHAAWQAGSISTGQMVAAMAVHSGGIGVTTAGAALGAAGGAALLAPTTIGATYGAAAGAGVGGGFASWGVGIAENKFYHWIGMRP